MTGKIMGIEIGNSLIKLIEVRKKGTKLIVEKFSLLETPRDCIQNGVMINSDVLYETISKELAAKKYKAKEAVVLLQSNTIIIRNIMIDKQPEKVIKQLLAIRPEEYLPVQQGQYQIDFRIIKEIKDSKENKIEILLVAAPNNIVLPMVNLLERLKLTPNQMTIPSEALVKVFGSDTRMISDLEGDVLVIDIGGKSTTATIISEGEAVLTRMIDFGAHSIEEFTKERADQPIAETDEYEITEVITNEYNQYLEDLIKPQLEYNIIAELERILQFYYSRFENKPIKKIYLIGGGANIQGMGAYIKETLNIPIHHLIEFSTVIEKKEIGFEPYRRFFVNLLGAINGI